MPTISPNPTTLSTAALRPRKLGLIGECSTTAYTSHAPADSRTLGLRNQCAPSRVPPAPGDSAIRASPVTAADRQQGEA